MKIQLIQLACYTPKRFGRSVRGKHSGAIATPAVLNLNGRHYSSALPSSPDDADKINRETRDFIRVSAGEEIL